MKDACSIPSLSPVPLRPDGGLPKRERHGDPAHDKGHAGQGALPKSEGASAGPKADALLPLEGLRCLGQGGQEDPGGDAQEERESSNAGGAAGQT